GGTLQSASFTGGIFQVLQPSNGTTVLQLVGGNFGVCPAKKRRLAANPPAAAKKKVVRDLWGNGQGQFQTKGRYAAATVRGTIWHLVDRCDGTLVYVQRGIVSVFDNTNQQTIYVTAGHSYLAK